MLIKILGTGCAKCTTLYDNVKAALTELGREAEVIKVQDIPSIMKYGVMSTPALVVDGQLTTLLTALILFQFGTGPIKGFAVTLLIGLIANLFTAVVFMPVVAQP